MRIIAGSKKKLNLYAPKTKNVRPTTDRAKESLFNLIGQKIDDAIFLDLFSGTGSIAFEAKSRGAKEVFAVDNNFESHEIIEKNMVKSKLEIKIQKSDVKNYINTVNNIFDIIFLDPPFDTTDEKTLEYIELIQQNNLLKEDGLLILERKSKKTNNEIYGKFTNLEIRKYGKISFIIIGRDK